MENSTVLEKFAISLSVPNLFTKEGFHSIITGLYIAIISRVLCADQDGEADQRGNVSDLVHLGVLWLLCPHPGGAGTGRGGAHGQAVNPAACLATLGNAVGTRTKTIF